jgi:hypothetical protein
VSSNDCPCSYCSGNRERREEQARDIVQYTVKCGYQGVEDLGEFSARMIRGRFPGQPDRIHCPCKGCGGELEEIVSVRVIKARRREREWV